MTFNLDKFSVKKIGRILPVVILSIAVISVFATGYLVKQRQEIRKKASTPTGIATISLLPASETHQLSESFMVNTFFNTVGVSISAIAIRLNYPFSGATPEIAASNIQINSDLLGSGDWSCPVRIIVPSEGTVKIDIGCVNTSIVGFSTSSPTLLFSFNLVANRIPSTNPTLLRFDPSLSVITRKSDGQDILLTPTSTGTYQIVSSIPTPTFTLTPTTSPPPPTPTVTSSPRPTVTATTTPTVTTSPPPPTPRPTATTSPRPTVSPTPRLTPTNRPTFTPTPSPQPGSCDISFSRSSGGQPIVYLGHHTDNTWPVIACYQNAGSTNQGLIKGCYCANKQYCDSQDPSAVCQRYYVSGSGCWEFTFTPTGQQPVGSFKLSVACRTDFTDYRSVVDCSFMNQNFTCGGVYIPTPTPVLSHTPTPRPTVTPRPTASPTPAYTATCEFCGIYDSNWNPITNATVMAGQSVYLVTRGSTNHPQGITKARFRVDMVASSVWCNGSGLMFSNNWCETTLKHGNDFYVLYTLSAPGQHTVQSMIYNPILGWY